MQRHEDARVRRSSASGGTSRPATPRRRWTLLSRIAWWLVAAALLALANDTGTPREALAARVYVPALFKAKTIPVYLNYSSSEMCYGNLKYTAFDLEKLEFIVNEVIENHNATSVSHNRLEYAGPVCLTEPFPFVELAPDAVQGRLWFNLMEQWTANYDLETHPPGIIVTAPSQCPADFAEGAAGITEDDLRDWADLGGRAGRLNPDDLKLNLQEDAAANGWPFVPWALVWVARVYDDDGATVCPLIDVDGLTDVTPCSIDDAGVTVGDPCPMGTEISEVLEACDCWNPVTASADEGEHVCEEAPDEDDDMEPDGDPRISGCRCPMTGAKLFRDAPGIVDPSLEMALAPGMGDPGAPLRCDVVLRGKAMVSTMAHEIGHALGIAHPFDKGGAAGDAPDTDEVVVSIMSYKRDEWNRSFGHSFFRLDDLEALRYLFHDPPASPAGWATPVAGANDWQEAFVVRWRGGSGSVGSSPPPASQWNSPNVVTSIASIVTPTLSTGATRAQGENYPKIVAVAWVASDRAVHVRTMGVNGLHSLPDTEVPNATTPHRPAVAVADPGIFVAWVKDALATDKTHDIGWAIRPAETTEWDEWDEWGLDAGLTAYCAGLSPCPDASPCVLDGMTCEYDGGLANLSGRVSVGYDQANAEFLLVYPASNLDLAVVRVSDAGQVLGWNYFHAGDDPRYITHFSRPICTTFTDSPLSSSVCSIVFIDNPRGEVRAVQWAPEGVDGALENENVVDLGIKAISGVELVGEGWADLGEYTLLVRGEDRGLDAYTLVLETTPHSFPLELPDGLTPTALAGLGGLDVDEEAVIPNWPPALGNRFSNTLANTVYTIWAAAPEPDNDPGTPYGDTDTDGNWGEAGSGCGCHSGRTKPVVGLILMPLLAGLLRRRRPANHLRAAGSERAA